MPYFITDKHPDCGNWGLVKEDGELIYCHPDKESATNHMIAISLEEGIDPAGEYQGDEFRAIEFRNEQGQPAIILDIDNTLIRDGEFQQAVYEYALTFQNTLIYVVSARLESQREETAQELESFGVQYAELYLKPTRETDSVAFKTEVAQKLLEEYNVMVAIDDSTPIRNAYAELGILSIHPNQTPSARSLEVKEVRQIDLSPPAYMRAAARRGIELYEEGRAGDGVTEQTIREARAMANGNVTADKYQRIAAWIARHLPDLDAPANQPGNDGFPGPGAVAFYLWGATPTPRGAERTRAYAESITTRIEQENEGRARGEALGKLELRTNPTEFEIRDEGEQGMRFTGYAAVFNSASQPLPFTERIAPGAFRRSLRARNDIKLLFNHDTGTVLGSTRAGTLTLQEDSRGLRVEAVLPPTTAGKDLSILLQRGDIDAMSFGFTVPSGGDSWSADGAERTLNSVRLHEVSIVPFPAYTATAGTASVRGLDKVAQRAEVDADALADALIKLETGEDISPEDVSLLDSVIKALGPKEPEAVEEVVEQEPEDDGKNILELKKKKLAALMKSL